MFGASSELASVMEFGFKTVGRMCVRDTAMRPNNGITIGIIDNYSKS